MNLTLHINNTILPTVKTPKILGLTFDPKLTYSNHIQNTTKRAKQTINILKALTSTHWGKSKETLTVTYKTITRPIIEYANTIWSPIASETNISKLQTIQNQALRTITGCTRDTNTQHLHEETKILPLNTHLKLHASQLRQQALHPEHPLHTLTTQNTNHRHKKQTIFDNNNNYTFNLDTPPNQTTSDTITGNLKLIHTHIVTEYINTLTPNKILNRIAPDISEAEKNLPHSTRRTLAQLRTNKSPLLQSYLHKIAPETHPTPQCPLCSNQTHDTPHLFNCPAVQTSLVPADLWANPEGAGELVARWRGLLGAGP